MGTKGSEVCQVPPQQESRDTVTVEGTDPAITPRGIHDSPAPRARAPQPHPFRLPGRGLWKEHGEDPREDRSPALTVEAHHRTKPTCCPALE